MQIFPQKINDLSKRTLISSVFLVCLFFVFAISILLIPTTNNIAMA